MSLSDEELAVVKAAADRAGLASRAWVGELAVRTARAGESGTSPVLGGWDSVMGELFALRSELVQQRRVLRNVGGNLNDVARHANSTGEVHASTGAVVDLVARVVVAVESGLGHVAVLGAVARGELVRSRR